MVATMKPNRWAILIVALPLAVNGAGCSSGPALVRAPNLYTASTDDPFADVPPQLQSTRAEVVYVTDRKPHTVDGVYGYSHERSRQIRFGVCTVLMGDDETTWEELARASRSPTREKKLPLTLTSIDERGEYIEHGGLIEVDGQWVENPADLQSTAESTAQFHALLSEKLARTPRKEVFIFVHGYANKFESGAFRTSQIWHFIGREGVPILYSWPAGSGGVLRGYTHDRESGEFTNPHIKLFLRAVASCPDVEKIHLIAHSRGTDVLATALRELHIETRASGKSTRSEFKLGQLVLAAPDIDLDVFIERFSADRVGFVPEQATVYVSPDDKAIGLSSWLFGSVRRVGQLAFRDLGPKIGPAIKEHPILSVVEFDGRTDRRGHGYFLSSPAVLSDFILVLRDGKPPGAEHGRPLLDVPGGFWELKDGYPFGQSE